MGQISAVDSFISRMANRHQLCPWLEMLLCTQLIIATFILLMRSLMEKGSRSLYGSVVMVLMMRMRSLFLLSQNLLHDKMIGSSLPLPASSNMYWFSVEQVSDQQLGFNICWARLQVLGYDICLSKDFDCDSDVSELLIKPVQLVRGSEMLEQEFVNILHVLQVVHCYRWKASTLQTGEVTIDNKITKLSEIHKQKINGLNSVVLNDPGLAARVFCGIPSKESVCIHFDWKGIVAAVNAWEDYTSTLINQIHLQLPYWRTPQSMYNVQVGE